MTENPRPPILRRARQRTIAIVIGAAVTTGILAAAIGGQAVAESGTGGSITQHLDNFSINPGDDDSGSTSDQSDEGGSGVGSSSQSGPSDGGSHSS